MQEEEVDVGAVRQQHVAVLQPRAQRVRPRRVVVRGVLHDRERRQPAADVEGHVGFGGGLLPAVPGPVDRVERELQRGRVDGEYPALQAEDEAFVLLVLREGRADGPEVLEHLPVEPLRDLRVAPPVGVGEGVALRGRRAPDAVQLRLVQPGRVADLVQAARAGDMAVEQRQHMAGAGESADVRPDVARDLVRQSRGNPLDDLAQGGVRCSRWPLGCAFTRLGRFFFHNACRLQADGREVSPFFQSGPTLPS